MSLTLLTDCLFSLLFVICQEMGLGGGWVWPAWALGRASTGGRRTGGGAVTRGGWWSGEWILASHWPIQPSYWLIQWIIDSHWSGTSPSSSRAERTEVRSDDEYDCSEFCILRQFRDSELSRKICNKMIDRNIWGVKFHSFTIYPQHKKCLGTPILKWAVDKNRTRCYIVIHSWVYLGLTDWCLDEIGADKRDDEGVRSHRSPKSISVPINIVTMADGVWTRDMEGDRRPHSVTISR